MSVEQTIEDMFECQQLVIAKMALAGWRFVPNSIKFWQAAYYCDGKRVPAKQVATTRYRLISPDGYEWAQHYEDVYGAACAAEQYMIRAELIERDVPLQNIDAAFKLRDDNEQ